MPTYQDDAGRLITVSGDAVEAAYEADPVWSRVEEPKKLTPKQQLQADAEAVGVSSEGTAEEIQARLSALVDLRTQAVALGVVDAETLPPVELAAAVEAKLAE